MWTGIKVNRIVRLVHYGQEISSIQDIVKCVSWPAVSIVVRLAPWSAVNQDKALCESRYFSYIQENSEHMKNTNNMVADA